ncbi:hypothetical protein BIW11_00894 [Tropilaelaps mercedesae]|uniref:Nuclear envelope membrane protein n=1 Tax=Tropilaelaps mercedesae TaxID=418985 RepID=A0A1V9XMQ7_9ACAR|nr:hypothetical protein BIW11_00894 [Tropilaelaps mercedesae]
MSVSRTIFCVTCLALCVLTLFSLAAVLSYPDFERAARPVYKSRCAQAWDLAVDVFLILAAFFLHYLLNCMDLFADFSTSSQRCIYSVVTAIITQASLFYWRRTSEFNVWSFGELWQPARYLILVLHSMCFLQLIANSVFDDAIEAFGFRNWSSNTSEGSDFETSSSYFNKSQELARLEGRLPSSGGLTSLTVLFLFYPTMPLERALAALAIISYNFCTSTLDEQDYFYVRRNFNNKWNELLSDDEACATSEEHLTGGFFRSGATSLSPAGAARPRDQTKSSNTWSVPISRSSSQESFYYEERNATSRNRSVPQAEIRHVAGSTQVAETRKSTRSSRKL